MEATLTFKAKDQASQALKRVGANIKGLTAPLKNVGSGLANMGRAFKKVTGETGQTASRLRLFAGGLAQTGLGVAGLSLKLVKLAAVAGLAGVSLVKLAATKVLSGLRSLAGGISNIGGALKGLMEKAAGALAKITALGGALAYGFKRVLVDVAAKAEACGLTLANALGGKALGESALKSVRAFSFATGHELEEVTKAFAALAEGGIKPTENHLKALADMAAKKNKTLAETGEAFRQALKGDAGALKDWGVESEARGKYMLYQYRDQAGQLIKLAAKINDPKGLSKVLSRIAQDKAGGADDQRAKSFGGGLQRLTAVWAEFRTMVMESGPFDYLKSQLAEVLAWVDKLKANGRLDELAAEWGTKLTDGLKAVKEGLINAWEAMQVWGPQIALFVEGIGGMQTVAVALGAVLAGPLVGAIGSVVKAVGVFGKILAFTPIGRLVAIITGVVALLDHFGVLDPLLDNIKKGFAFFADAVGPALTGLLDTLGDALGLVGDLLKAAFDWLLPDGWSDWGEVLSSIAGGAVKLLVSGLTGLTNILGGAIKKLREFFGLADKDVKVTASEIEAPKLKRPDGRDAPGGGYHARPDRGAGPGRDRGPSPYQGLGSMGGQDPARRSGAPGPDPLAGKMDVAARHLQDIRGDLSKPQKLNLTVTLKGAVDGATVTGTVATNTPGAKISDSRAQAMGHGGVTS